MEAGIGQSPRGGYGTTAEPAKDVGQANSKVEEVGFSLSSRIDQDKRQALDGR